MNQKIIEYATMDPLPGERRLRVIYVVLCAVVLWKVIFLFCSPGGAIYVWQLLLYGEWRAWWVTKVLLIGGLVLVALSALLRPGKPLSRRIGLLGLALVCCGLATLLPEDDAPLWLIRDSTPVVALMLLSGVILQWLSTHERGEP